MVLQLKYDANNNDDVYTFFVIMTILLVCYAFTLNTLWTPHHVYSIDQYFVFNICCILEPINVRIRGLFVYLLLNFLTYIHSSVISLKFRIHTD